MVRFTKMHGLGNDYLVVEALKEAPAEEKLPGIAKALVGSALRDRGGRADPGASFEGGGFSDAHLQF